MRVEWPLFRSGRLATGRFARRQAARATEVNRKARQHAATGSGKPIMPAPCSGEGSADERREKGANIDADIEDRIRAIAAEVVRPVKRAHLAGDVRLECADAKDEEQQGEHKQRLEGH